MTAREPLDAGRIFAPDERSLAVMLEAQARKFGAKPLVQAGEQSWSFAEAPELAARSAGPRNVRLASTTQPKTAKCREITDKCLCIGFMIYRS